MSIPHLKAGEIINLYHPASDFPASKTFALTKTEHMEAIRLTIPAGKSIPAHSVQGELTVLSLAGELEFSVGEEVNTLVPGDWLHLNGGQEHCLRAIADSTILVTILL